MLYASLQQHLPVSNDDEENRVPLLDAEYSWSLCLVMSHTLHFVTFLQILVCCRNRDKVTEYSNTFISEESEVNSVCSYYFTIISALVCSKAPYIVFHLTKTSFVFFFFLFNISVQN
jgi:hypothetical protein